MTVPSGIGYNAYYDRRKRRDDSESDGQSCKRFKSEAPLSQQLRNASPSDPDHRRRIQALQGLPPEDDDEQDTKSMHPQTIQVSRKERQGGGADTLGEYETGNNRLAVPDLGDILNNFKVPEGPRIFKSEPVNTNLWAGELAQKSNPKKKQKKDRQITSVEPPPASREMSSGAHEVRSGRDLHTRLIARMFAPSESPDIVDLTEDNPQRDENFTRAPNREHPSQVPTSNLPQPLTAGQIHIMDQTDVPQNILRQAAVIYQRENTAMPANIKKWAQLKSFVLQHPASPISPHLCLVVQAHAFHAASALSLSRPSHIPVHSNVTATQSATTRTTVVRSVGRDNIRGDCASSEEHQIKAEPGEKDLLHQQDNASAERPPNDCPNPAGISTSSRSLAAPGTTRPAIHPSQIPTVQSPITNASKAEIQNLYQPSDQMPDILPADASSDAPHLIPLWDPTLLNLPVEQHDHLKLPDTVVSILAKCDIKTKSTVTAFLDMKKVNHFFFLFKARDGVLHSWSVEREDDVVTIGIERPTRAPNLNATDQPRPSSGQYDLTIQYRMLPSSPRDPAAWARASPDQITSAAVDRHLAFTYGTENVAYPGRWVLLNTSTFPSNPDLFTFLHHTPPTRGADEHEIYSHPSQSALLPTSYLSTFARYMQQTAFTTSVMDAEIQVAYGRKVRYDSVLGRVRVVWDYALKGARTQRRKRDAGEYNRPRKGDAGRCGNGSREVPGFRMSKEYLAGGLGGHDTRSGGGGESRGGSTLVEVGGTDRFVVDEAGLGEECGGSVRGEDEEKMRKRVKMERTRMRGSREESGSEYSDGSDSN